MPVVMPYAHKLMSPSRNVVSTIRTSSTESSTNERPNANQSLARIRKARQASWPRASQCNYFSGSLFILQAAVADISICKTSSVHCWLDGLIKCEIHQSYTKKRGAMTSVPSVADAVTELASKFSGQLLQPADAGYEEARKVHNGLVNKHPALIARCHGVADVVDAVNLARKLSLEVAVRGGGHNVAGRATVEGG